MNRISFALLAALLVVTPVAGWSQTTDTPKIDQRVQNKAKRTEQGVASGNLTKTEAARLKRRLTAAQNGESRRTARQKTNAQRAVN